MDIKPTREPKQNTSKQAKTPSSLNRLDQSPLTQDRYGRKQSLPSRSMQFTMAIEEEFNM
jgi:hypothetical protein